MNTKRQIEIKGVKLEVDLREATEIHTYKVGDPVKVLVKEYSGYKCYPGVILAFVPFKELPSIEIAYMKYEYSRASVEVVTVNENTESAIEVCPADSLADLGISRERILDHFADQIVKKQGEIQDVERQRDFFLRRFGMYFQDADSAVQ